MLIVYRVGNEGTDEGFQQTEGALFWPLAIIVKLLKFPNELRKASCFVQCQKKQDLRLGYMNSKLTNFRPTRVVGKESLYLKLCTLSV